MGQTAAYLVQGAAGLSGSLDQATAIRDQGAYARTVGDMNAKIAEQQAQDALKRGDTAASEHSKRVKVLLGSQRTAMAASGVDSGYGTNLDIQGETRDMGSKDILTIKNNAAREAWGYAVTANNYRTQGQLDEIGANFKAKSTILTGGMQFASGLAQAGNAYEGKSKPTTKKAEYKKPSGPSLRSGTDANGWPRY